MKKINGGITAPQGFQAAGMSSGIKKSGKPDLALIYSVVPATAAGIFTTNQVKAAPVMVSAQQLKYGVAQAIIANAGNANCWTGGRGMQDAWKMVNETAKVLKISPAHVLVASTGVIARPMPMDKVLPGVRRIGDQLSLAGGEDAARAILTTDKNVKEIAVKIGEMTVAGIAKGSGMIAPGMATMFAFITTDAKIAPQLLRKMLVAAAEKTFNMVSVDNCMSTNDCVLALANGLSGETVTDKNARQFYVALEYVCRYLAIEIARDGEGAGKLMTVKVKGAVSEADARQVVKALINSFLLKAAVYGRDKNVGRILQAMGTTSAKVNWGKMRFSWNMGNEEDVITINLGSGKAEMTGWGCDLTEGYVHINAKYHT
jgi:glutamate N-acetyltransferase/amino-acid N-acetyltransferase